MPFSERSSSVFTEDEVRKREVFNYRLSRARRVVESSFGILTSKFRCLRNSLEMQPESVDIIVRACCLLHNIIINQEGTRYSTAEIESFSNEHHSSDDPHIPSTRSRNSTNAAKNTRNLIMEYFCSEGRVSFQPFYNTT